MATEDPMHIMAANRMRAGLGVGDNIGSAGGGGLSSSAAHEGVAQELDMLLRSHSRLESMLHRRDVIPHRSGSAPPSVEGSLASMGGFFSSGVESRSRLTSSGSGDGMDIIDSEQELRSDPAYLEYYYSHINLNPRLPPPLLSREKYLLAQRLAVGGFGDKRKLRSLDDSNSRSLFSSQPVLPTHNEEPESSEDDRSPMGYLLRQVSDKWAEVGADGLLGIASNGFDARPKSLVDLIQEDFPRTPSPVYNQSRSSSHAANDDTIDGASGLDVHLAQLRDSSISAAAVAELSAALLGSRSATPSAVLASRSATPSAVLASRSATPNPVLSSRSATPNPAAFQVGGGPIVVPSGSSVPAPRIPTPDPSSTGDAFLGDMPGLTIDSNNGTSHSRSGSLAASSSAAQAAELVAALQGLSLSSVQGTSSVEQQEHMHLPIEAQQQLQQETRDQHHSLRLQQSQRHSQRSQNSQAQSQMSQSQVFVQALQQQQQQLLGLEQNYRAEGKYTLPNLTSQMQNATLQPGPANNMYAAAAAAAAMSYMAAGNPYYQNLQAGNIYAPQYGIGGYGMNPPFIPGMMANYPFPVAYDTATAAAAAAAAAVAAGMGARVPSSASLSGLGLDIHQLYKYTGQAGTSLQSHLADPLYLHYLQQHSAEEARAAVSLNDPSLLRGYATGSHINPLELQKNQLSSMLGYPAERKGQFSRSGSIGASMGSKSGSVSPVYYSTPGVGFVMPYANSPISSPVLPGSPVVPGAVSFRQAEQNYRLSSGAGRTTAGGLYMGWPGQKASDTGEELKGLSLLEELKNNKIRKFELADIAGHVVEFSTDQHGSRFIQQKLETVSSEEKASVFQEVLPQALALMTDVFGNYVIQKFFEHGTPQQRSELANHLVGHVLNLSLQMYGCRVIQKALEVVDIEEQKCLVSELDGHVMRCVRDQNGNHVIQKCIECVPCDHIHFIISAFYGQVVMLSTHPYGCRVIQRVLEYCTDDQKQNLIMEEIMSSICTLAQDQYGNYVVQHVLEHGKPHEKSEILAKLAGQIVQMSQHKFASNVVEKCLEFGGPTERQILISEMLGHSDENEPLQAMMKDQYANYVVQKVLETCDDQQRELLLSRIRVHLHALKKYTYGKHIVARVEKLVAAGERRGAQV